jgi:signal peptidase I
MYQKIAHPPNYIQRIIFLGSGAILLAFLLYFGIITPFVTQKFQLQDDSMMPNFAPYQSVRVEKFFWQRRTPPVQRGEIYVIKADLIQKHFIMRRVIGLPGETIRIMNQKIYINGQQLAEPWQPRLNQKTDFPLIQSGHFLDKTRVPANHYFVLGDNRGASFDSRQLGMIPRKQFIGRVIW